MAVDGGGAIYLFGGWDDAKRELSDLWEFRPRHHVWTQLTSNADLGVAPSPRTCAALAYHQDTLILYGGCNARQQYGEMYEYRLPARPQKSHRGHTSNRSDHTSHREHSEKKAGRREQRDHRRDERLDENGRARRRRPTAD